MDGAAAAPDTSPALGASAVRGSEPALRWDGAVPNTDESAALAEASVTPETTVTRAELAAATPLAAARATAARATGDAAGDDAAEKLPPGAAVTMVGADDATCATAGPDDGASAPDADERRTDDDKASEPARDAGGDAAAQEADGTGTSA